MLYVIYPKDKTTEFLLEIPSIIIGHVGKDLVKVISIEASEESYESGIKEIQALSDSSFILFMGHGQNDMLFGAESDTFPKRPFITKSDVKIFEKKYVFSLSCYSNELLKSTFGFANITNSIGFGSLPTEMIEVENNKRLSEQGVTGSIIDRYKLILVELVSMAFGYLIKKKVTFFEMSNYFLLLLNKKISEIILADRTNKESRILADLLFQMRSEMVYI